MSSRTPPRSAFTPRERALVDELRTPRQVQRWLRRLPYNWGKQGETQRSFRGVVKFGEAHCLETVLAAATILDQHGYPPMVLDLESRDGLDHVLFVFRHEGRWGAVGRSRDWGLHGRPPVFTTIPALARTYMDPFVDGSGRLVRWGTANLDDLVRVDWRLSARNVWAVEQALIDMRHRRITMPQVRYQRMRRRYLALKERTGRTPDARTVRELYGAQVDRWW